MRGASFLAWAVALSCVLVGCTQVAPQASGAAPGSPGGSASASSPTAAPSGPGSIVFIRAFNVWLAGPDGSGARQLTTDGTETANYHDPSQADDGTIWVVKGANSLHRLDRSGHDLASAVTLATLEHGAEGVAVAADSSHVAYTTVGTGQEVDPRFGTPTGTFLYGGTDIANPDGTSVAGAVLPNMEFPSWIGDSHVVVTDGVDLYLDTVGSAPPIKILSEQDGCLTDFDCPAGKEAAASLSSPTVSDDGTVMAFSYVPYYGPGGRRMAVQTDPTTIHPRTRCLIQSATQNNDTGSLSRYGQVFYYDDTAFDSSTFETKVGQGIWAFPVNLDADDCGSSAAALILPQGSQPDWGPAAP
ncbi:MAG: hypothetical protein QOH68_4074 [Nocardioidaceae bacterium]|nr:hypothetical protein [Nocardioidaceae bacterium]